jgi:hypothetical protein
MVSERLGHATIAIALDVYSQVEVVPLAVELRRRSMAGQAASCLVGVTAATVWSSAVPRAGRYS